MHLQNPPLYCLANVPKMPKDIKKARYEISTIKLVLKRCKTFTENYFKKLISPKIGPFYVFAGQNTILTEPREQFCYGAHLTVA